MELLAQIKRLKWRLDVAMEDYVLTRPMPLFRPAFVLSPDTEAQAQAAVEQLRATGAFLAGIRVSGERLASFRAALDDAYEGRVPDVNVHHNTKVEYSLVRNPLKLHPAALELATDSFLCGIVERYLRRNVVLTDVDMRRIPPISMEELERRSGAKSTSSHWHRDIRGRQVKIMIYLTDVTEKDSNFVFVPGTHKGHYARPLRYEKSRFDDAWIDARGIFPVECYGPAGTAMVFDTNLIHRLRRKPGGTVRDSVTFYYTPGQETRFLDVDPNRLAGLPEPARSLFKGRRPVSAHITAD